MSLTPISEAEARRLIISGTAGYWSIHPRSVPVPNEHQTILRLQGQLFIVPASRLEVAFAGALGEIGGRQKGAFYIKCSDEEITALAKQEMETKSAYHDGVMYHCPEKQQEPPEKFFLFED
jgi:hypothetical protein